MINRKLENLINIKIFIVFPILFLIPFLFILEDYKNIAYLNCPDTLQNQNLKGAWVNVPNH